MSIGRLLTRGSGRGSEKILSADGNARIMARALFLARLRRNKRIIRTAAFPGVYLWTVEYLSGYLIYAAGLTRGRFHDRFDEHTGKYLAGQYTVLNISDMQLGRRSEVVALVGMDSCEARSICRAAD